MKAPVIGPKNFNKRGTVLCKISEQLLLMAILGIGVLSNAENKQPGRQAGK
jgi:hypothetical protein